MGYTQDQAELIAEETGQELYYNNPCDGCVPGDQTCEECMSQGCLDE